MVGTWRRSDGTRGISLHWDSGIASLCSMTFCAGVTVGRASGRMMADERH
jgi:hypothetical protein